MKAHPAHSSAKVENATQNRYLAAFLYAIPVGLVGGLVGLGGAEFRLSVLVGALRFPVRRAVPLNLAVSLVTLLVAFVTRGRVLSLALLAPWALLVLCLGVGAIAAAYYGVTLAHRMSDERLALFLRLLLVGVGILLVVSGALPQVSVGLLPGDYYWHIGAGLFCGLGVGLLSSTGIAGGQLMIAVLVFLFGVDIRTAGTSSLLINLPKVGVVVGRYARSGAYSGHSDVTRTVLPMSLGSGVGAVTGGLIVGLVPVALLKVTLGVILILSAVRVFRKPNAADSGELGPSKRGLSAKA